MRSYQIIFVVSLALACGVFATVQDTDDQIINHITNNLVEMIDYQYNHYQHDKQSYRLRMAHAKPHGCIRATLHVYDNLPSNLAQGIFDTKKQNSTYPAMIRFSNGIGRGFAPIWGTNTSDAVPDTRGFGLKLFGVQGQKILPGEENAETQDFLMITSPLNFLANLKEAKGFFNAVHDGALSFTHYLALHPIIAAKYARLAVEGTGVTNLLAQTYWGEAAIAYGNTFARFRVDPCNNKRKTESIANFLRENLADALSGSSACFVFSVQLYQDPQSTPLEDATAAWSSPWNDVAYIDIPSQSFGTKGQEQFCEWLAYNPYHAIPEHKPVGAVQKLRGVAYQKSAQERHKLLNQRSDEANYNDWLSYPTL